MSENKVETEVVQEPAAEEKKSKETSKAVDSIIKSIEKLTVLELVSLVKTLEDKFGVSAAAPVGVMAAPMAQGAGGDAPAKEEKSEFQVVLTGYGDKKIQVIKVIREITGLGLKEAKDLVDNVPGTVKENALKDDAENIKKKIEEAGGTIELK